jgi:hypothetical protein
MLGPRYEVGDKVRVVRIIPSAYKSDRSGDDLSEAGQAKLEEYIGKVLTIKEVQFDSDTHISSYDMKEGGSDSFYGEELAFA